MDTERPSPPPHQPPFVLPGLEQSPFDAYAGFVSRPQKFRHRYRTHIILFLLTLFTTTFRESFSYVWDFAFSGLFPPLLQLFTWAHFVSGLWYSIPLLIILSAHEFGHYFACRYYDVDATLPYYLPVPLPLTGTLGAVIRIREPFPSKRALFDIGVAGPIGGFIALVPLLFWGVWLSQLAPVVHDAGVLELGEPLLFKAVSWLHFGNIPAGYEVSLHPVGFAAWFGMLATSLNLMPFGQLDGGHISYAVLGRRAAYVSLATLGAVVVLTALSYSWIWMTVMMFAMAFFLGLRHPRVVDEDAPLDRSRQLVAAFALFMFVICFMPIPIDILGGR